jgi:hypothetical protein|tara:strand:- start:651 stop:911 length:261 start_codon:yes stop_codon:yes gene_type:complete
MFTNIFEIIPSFFDPQITRTGRPRHSISAKFSKSTPLAPSDVSTIVRATASAPPPENAVEIIIVLEESFFMLYILPLTKVSDFSIP